VLEVELDDDLELDDYYETNFRRMFGNERMDAAIGSGGKRALFGLTPTSMKLEGLDRHQRLLDSYRKLHKSVCPGHAAA
jgi:ribosomal protein S12 methylthiotransferase accessory factor